MFENLCSIMSTDDNWQLYRQYVSAALSKPPFIPFLGQFLTDCIQNETFHQSITVTAKQSSLEIEDPNETCPIAPQQCDLEEGGKEKIKVVVSGENVTIGIEMKEKPTNGLSLNSPKIKRCLTLPCPPSSIASTPSPTSASSRCSLEKSDSGVSSHGSFSCPDIMDLFNLAAGDSGYMYKISKRRRSSSAQTLYPYNSLKYQLFNKLRRSGSLSSLNYPPNESRASSSDDSKYDKLELTLVDDMYETDTASSHLDLSSFSSLEELVASDEDSIDRVFGDRTPGSPPEGSRSLADSKEHSMSSCSTKQGKDTLIESVAVDLEDVKFELEAETKRESEASPSNAVETPPQTPRKQNRFSSFRKKAGSSLRGIMNRRKVGNHSVHFTLGASSTGMCEQLEMMQIASLGYAGFGGPQIAVRKFLLTAEYLLEKEAYAKSLASEPPSQDH